jgi:hypothetical protein
LETGELPQLNDEKCIKVEKPEFWKISLVSNLGPQQKKKTSVIKGIAEDLFLS